MLYIIDQTVLKVKQQKVFHNDIPLPLSDRGHVCLMFFLAANGQVLSKEKLMSLLWQDVIVSDDSLFKVIQEVRKGLVAIDVKNDVLKNIYGKGYQLRQVVKKEKMTHAVVSKKVVALLIGILFLAVILFLIYPKAEVINDQQFAKLVKDIEADFIAAEIDFSTLKVSTKSTALDQLKLA